MKERNTVKNKVINSLNKDKVNTIDLMIAIQMGADILYFEDAGLLIKSIDDIYMIHCTNIDLGKKWISTVKNPRLFVVHQQEYIEVIEKLFSLKKQLVVNQAIYLHDEVEVKKVEGIEIRKLGIKSIRDVKDNYSIKLDEEYLRRQLQQPYFFGAYEKNILVGFIGVHEEMSIGFLEVFPNY